MKAWLLYLTTNSQYHSLFLSDSESFMNSVMNKRRLKSFSSADWGSSQQREMLVRNKTTCRWAKRSSVPPCLYRPGSIYRWLINMVRQLTYLIHIHCQISIHSSSTRWHEGITHRLTSELWRLFSNCPSVTVLLVLWDVCCNNRKVKRFYSKTQRIWSVPIWKKKYSKGVHWGRKFTVCNSLQGERS